MSDALQANGHEAIQVVAGEELVLRIRAHDPAGINRIVIQCFQFSMASTTKVKQAAGEIEIASSESVNQSTFEVPILIPENAALGKWGVQLVEFTNGRGYKTSFYRGQSKFDDVVFEVVSTQEDEFLRFSGLEIAGRFI